YDLKKNNGSNKGEITFKIKEVFGPSNSYEAEVKALAKELNLPIRYVGIGEKIDDLVVFDPKKYVENLFN
ncbi:MAG: hypothetical protein ACK419_03520, partial [Pyrinomonadaceae bacterium]